MQSFFEKKPVDLDKARFRFYTRSSLAGDTIASGFAMQKSGAVRELQLEDNTSVLHVFCGVIMRFFKAYLQHRFNPLHVYCRMRDYGLPTVLAIKLSSAYERVYRAFGAKTY